MFGPAFLTGAWAWSDPGHAAGLCTGGLPIGDRASARRRQHRPLVVRPRRPVERDLHEQHLRHVPRACRRHLPGGSVRQNLLITERHPARHRRGLAIGSGNGHVFFELVVAHGMLELPCITVAGAAGLRLGWSIVDLGLADAPGLTGGRSATVGRDRLRDDGLARHCRTDRGLHAPGREESLSTVLVVGLTCSASSYWTLALWRGVDQSSPCDFARRYDLTQAAGSAAAGASTTSASRTAQQGDGVVAGRDHAERHGRPRRRFASRARVSTSCSQAESVIACDGNSVPPRQHG